MNHDIPTICPSCEISVLPGTDHTTDDGCFEALKAYVKLCQDEIEEQRMGSYQHPTREELIQELAYLEEQFGKFIVYAGAIHERIKNARRGTLVR